MAIVLQKEIGQKMKARREYLRLSQEEIASQIPTNRVTYGRWENGQREISAEDLQRVASALKVPLSFFIPEDEWAPDGEIAAFYNGMPPDYQPVILEMIKAAHKAIERERTTHGRKAE